MNKELLKERLDAGQHFTDTTGRFRVFKRRDYNAYVLSSFRDICVERTIFENFYKELITTLEANKEIKFNFNNMENNTTTPSKKVYDFIVANHPDEGNGEVFARWNDIAQALESLSYAYVDSEMPFIVEVLIKDLKAEDKEIEARLLRETVNAYLGKSEPVNDLTTREGLLKETIKRFGKDWKNVKIKRCLCHGNIADVNTGHFEDAISHELHSVWNRNGLIYDGKSWAEPA